MEPTGRSCHEQAMDDPLTRSVSLFDLARLPLKSWCAGSREDAVTGLALLRTRVLGGVINEYRYTA